MQQKSLFTDSSLWMLILSNLLTILLAVTEQWSLGTVMWVYWCQSVIIGVFNFFRILSLKEFSTKNFKINDSRVDPTPKTKRFVAFFFLMHYSGFHFVYLIFLLAGALTHTVDQAFPPTVTIEASSSSVNSSLPLSDLPFVALSTLIFLGNHFYSYRQNNINDTGHILNIGSVMIYPYARILPMHITIILGATAAGDILLFLVLKTIADGIMHVVEHRALWGRHSNT